MDALPGFASVAAAERLLSAALALLPTAPDTLPPAARAVRPRRLLSALCAHFPPRQGPRGWLSPRRTRTPSTPRAGWQDAQPIAKRALCALSDLSPGKTPHSLLL